MDYRYRLTGRAIADARQYSEQIASYSPNLAEKWTRGILARIATLRSFPLICPRAPESEKFGDDVRELIYGKKRSTYRILFVVRDDVVVVLAIWRASRGPAEL